MSDLTDRVLGDFRLVRRLGVGGMAEVYLAEQISLKRSVAVKILLNDAVGKKSGTLLRRFEQEARAAGGLNHPNIVQVYMIGQEGSLNYIVQEYVSGQNLSQWFKRNGPPDFLTGLKLMNQVAAALKAASDAGIVHRDIKPENIMLTRDGDAKVTDFGLAQLNEITEKMNLTQAGTTMGTPWYMSPEQIQGEKLDHRSDQYSFGVSCYHMFAGQPPFPGKNSVSVAVQHLKEEAAPLSRHRSELPSALCQLIHRMMAKKPADRFESPEQLVTAIAALKDEPLRSELSDSVSFSEWVKASLPSWKSGVASLLVCVLIGFLVGRNVFSPVKLVAGNDEIPQETSASRQYARALLPPRSEAAWKAVYRHFPGSDEALWARLQLAIYHLSRATPAYSPATEAFDDLLTHTSLDPVDWRDLRFLAVLGKAYVAEQKGQVGERNTIILSTILEQYPDEFETDIAAPQLLHEFHISLREQFAGAE